jgi:disease resistance protein
MAAPRGDGMLLCQRIGCDAKYREEANAEGSCRHHPGPPVFHDGGKEWSCCKQRSHDFGLFMSIPGCARRGALPLPAAPDAPRRGTPRAAHRSCATGKHTQEKPAKPPAAAARGPAPLPLPLGEAARAAGAGGRDACIRCRQGFFCADHPAEPPAAPVEPPKPPVRQRMLRSRRAYARARCRRADATPSLSSRRAAAQAARGPGCGADVPQQGLRQQGAPGPGRAERIAALRARTGG